ncbi:GTPase family protein, partial [Georgenia sp.]
MTAQPSPDDGRDTGAAAGTVVRDRAPRLDAVLEMLTEVERTRFPLDLPGTPEIRAERDAVRTQLGSRLVPRLRRGSAPVVVVLGGASGSGKSTLLNSALGTGVSEAGVLRPTTRTPVLVIHPDDVDAFGGHPLAEAAQVVTTGAVPAGLAVLDTPDLESARAAGGALGAQLLEVADLWIFVTTAARYGDAVPWRVLAEAQDRGITTAVILNRVPARVRSQVRQDLLNRMVHLGLGSAPLFLVADAGPHEGLLPPEQLVELTTWLRLVADRRQSPALVRRTTRGVWSALRAQLLDLAAGADAQAEAGAELRARAQRAADDAAATLVGALRSGSAGLGAPTTRWLALASTGGPLAPLVTGATPRRGWRGHALETRSTAARQLGTEVDAAVQVLVADAVRTAGTAIRWVWDAPELGARTLLDAGTADPAALAAA